MTNNMKRLRCVGAVWAEFIVSASFLLVGFFLIVPLIAKVVDTRQKSELAARYATWERTVWFEDAPSYFPNQDLEKSNSELENELHYRVFASKDEVIDSQSQRRVPRNVEYDPFLNFQNRSTGTYETVLEPSGQDLVSLSQFESKPPSGIGAAIDTAVGTLFRFGNAPLNDKGYYSGEVSVPIKQFAWIDEFRNVTPVFKANGAILADAWNTDRNLAEERAVSLMFKKQLEDSGALDAIRTVQDIAGTLPPLRDIRSSNLKLFETDIDAVPSIRITDPE